jgi:hypothetical protein
MKPDRTIWSKSKLAGPASQGNQGRRRGNLAVPPQRKRHGPALAVELGKLYETLESYAPPWYSEAHHKKVQSAVRRGGKSTAAVFSELCDLLEAYAPSWYTKEHHERAQSILKVLRKR